MKITRCAIKMTDTLVSPHQDLVSTIKEIEFLIKCQNKYIIEYICHFPYERRPCIVTYFYRVLYFMHIILYICYHKSFHLNGLIFINHEKVKQKR